MFKTVCLDFGFRLTVPATCAALCNAKPGSVAYSFRRPVTGLQPTCTLLKNVDSVKDEWTYTSGFAGTTFF